MDIQGEVVLRQRVCGRCGAVFWICRHCDRGQRYCRPACRHQVRIGQRRRANGRHQRSPEGRLDHRDRQRAYRRRRAQRACVTDQGSLSVTCSVNMREWDRPSTRLAVHRSPAGLFFRRGPDRRPGRRPRCILCGRRGRFVEAFPRIALRR